MALRPRRRARALATCLLACVLAQPAAAAPRADAGLPSALSADVTLSAPNTGYLRVRLTREIDLRHLNIVDTPPSFSGSGPVGFALLPDRVGSLGPHVVMVRAPTRHGSELVLSPSSGYRETTSESLRPGVYRLFFLTRGGGSIRLRFPGQPAGHRRLTAGTRVPWTLGEYRAPVDANGTAPSTWEATLDFHGRNPGHVFGALWFGVRASAYSYGDACFYGDGADAERAVPMCQHGKGRGPTERIGPRVDEVERLWTGGVYDRAPGRQGFRVCYTSAGAVHGAGALLFFLPAA